MKDQPIGPSSLHHIVTVGTLVCCFAAEASAQRAIGLGDAAHLRSAYKQRQQARDEGSRLVVTLGWAKGLSVQPTKATGRLTLDWSNGSVDVQVRGLPRDQEFDVWMIDNQPGPGRNLLPSRDDRRINLGRLDQAAEEASLKIVLDENVRVQRELDLVIVTRSGQDPATSGLLFGAPNLFQRLDRRTQLDRVPSRRNASASLSEPSWDFDALVDRGERLFFNETFFGNGRTCGTCHPAENNLTIDPKFIATLPNDDPLFVAEFLPALKQNFEKPVLMRKLGLILENTDGFEDLENKFTMRGVPHMLALRTSLNPSTGDGTTVPPVQRTGWSGDGAPGDGSLRLFAVGAVVQHFTKTLERRPGVDFRLPSDDELDAMEAFQLSLGRQEELNLSRMEFSSPIVRRGKELFLNEGKCNRCHANAGANVMAGPILENFNFDTGVEALPDQPADLIDAAKMPPDGGFGRDPNPNGGFGNGTFNTATVIEAADTGPFFHNNAVATIEEAVNFYNSDAFNQSPSGQFIGGISLAATQVEAIAALARVLNALENIRLSMDTVQRAGQQARPRVICRCVRGRFVSIPCHPQKHRHDERLIAISLAELHDAVEVLEAQGMHPGAVADLKSAIRLEEAALVVPNRCKSEDLLRQARQKKQAAQSRMVTVAP